MLHIYCGDGKGKTTAAMGLAIRAAGHGRKVVVAQFLKGNNSGERVILAAQPNIQCLPVPETMKFTFEMTEEEKERAWQETADSFDLAARLGREADLLVLDEACAAISTGMLSLDRVLDFLDSRPPELEVVITGRDPDPELLNRADYVTEMRKVKHPFDHGQNAREGVEW
ncbi:MAG: cob(I)yrinic acid a,c-diamide adenosyltransferase [Oscillospiraceae bacterium]|nr:cob(I)yrinic acid a,c-diamide adenosyltransferase [Oscillospiraceae bacterium]